jgi:MSHA biogenesis protein MshJ
MTLKEHWLDWSARFAALQQREKLMVAGAVLFAILFGGYTFWIEPAQLKKSRLQKTIAQQRDEQAQLATQLAALIRQTGDPDAANRAELERMEKRIAETRRDIQGFDRLLVPPEQAPTLLQALLARHRGLNLVSLTTLPPRPLIEKTANADEKPAVSAGGNIYRHGIEIKVVGSYLDLLAYVAELEGNAQKLLWDGMHLSSTYPVSELTLTVYTLSLESAWLVV